MAEREVGLSPVKWLGIITAIIALTNIAVLLDIPVLRQIFGFLFLTFAPGFLILLILKLNKLDLVARFVLSVGLSVAFSMLFGLLVNSSLLAIGYTKPLSTAPLLVSFSIALFILAVVAYVRNKDITLPFSSLKLTSTEKTFLVIPSLFPVLSILGMRIMNTTNNNVLLMSLLFIIPAYIIFMCFSEDRIPQRVYPVTILMVGVALTLIFSLRSTHIMGADVHRAYYFFQITSQSLHWSVVENSLLNACLSITLLPSIVQSILNINGEYLFKVFYSLIFAIAPLCVYSLSKRYVQELYAFLASVFFMSQIMFLQSAYSPRTVLAIFFFALAMMVLLDIELKPMHKSLLFIIFMTSVTVSHYSATYIFFFLVLGEFLVLLIMQKTLKTGRDGVSKGYDVTPPALIVGLFFIIIFFWYGLITKAPFTAAANFIKGTFVNLQEFFIFESRAGGNVPAVLGENIMYKGIPHKIEFVLTWIIFAFIAIGALTMLRRVIFSHNSKRLKPGPLKANFQLEYLVMTLLCGALLVAMVALPGVGALYGTQRGYAQASVILSVSFVVAGIILSKYIRVKPYLLILLVLIPYFLCVSGPMYQIFGYPRDITLNSEGSRYDRHYIHEQESCSAKWLRDNAELRNTMIYTDYVGRDRLRSQALILRPMDAASLLQKDKEIGGYIYLRYYNVVNGKLLDGQGREHDIIEFRDKFEGKNMIYSNGGSQIYR